MNTSIPTNAPTLSQVLDEFALVEGIPQAATLDEFVRQYPYYANELTEFAVYLLTTAHVDLSDCQVAEAGDDPSIVSPSASKAISQFHNALYDVRMGADAPGSSTQAQPERHSASMAAIREKAIADFTLSNRSIGSDAFESENFWANLPQTAYRNAAASIGVSKILLIQLRDGQIRPETVPDAFKQKLAEGLGVASDLVFLFFAKSRSSPRPAAQYLKSADKPTDVAPQSLQEALQALGVKEDKQRELLQG